eukprot:6198625-Pleurochrysis_carterae.AAC.1
MTQSVRAASAGGAGAQRQRKGAGRQQRGRHRAQRWRSSKLHAVHTVRCIARPHGIIVFKVKSYDLIRTASASHQQPDLIVYVEPNPIQLDNCIHRLDYSTRHQRRTKRHNSAPPLNRQQSLTLYWQAIIHQTGFTESTPPAVDAYVMMTSSSTDDDGPVPLVSDKKPFRDSLCQLGRCVYDQFRFKGTRSVSLSHSCLPFCKIICTMATCSPLLLLMSVLLGARLQQVQKPVSVANMDTSRNQSGGCGHAFHGVTGKLHSRTLMVGDTERDYLLWVPQNYDLHRAYPLLLSFHGASASPVIQALGDQLFCLADAAPYIVAYPAAYSRDN